MPSLYPIRHANNILTFEIEQGASTMTGIKRITAAWLTILMLCLCVAVGAQSPVICHERRGVRRD